MVDNRANRETIIEQIGGQDLYEEACHAARLAAGDSNDGGNSSTPFNSKIPHKISNLIWDSPLTTEEKVYLAFRFYTEMPCYAYLMYLKQNFREFSVNEKIIFWEWVRVQLDSNDMALIAPVAYSLWCDFWEDPQTVNESWKALVTPLPSDNALQLILIHSGPVPFPLKQTLYNTLIQNEAWHYYIYRSLLHSHFDAYGNLNRHAAKAILKRLTLSPDTEHLETLRKSLGF